MGKKRGKRPGDGRSVRKRPPKPIGSPPVVPGHGKGTRHSTTGSCMLAKVVGAVILSYFAAAFLATLGAATL
jgi:hypothetical protein